jgi:hypothetical protein
MRALPFLILLFLSSFAGVPVSAAEEELSAKNNLLRAEYQLAKISRIYMLFDLPGKKIQIKIRGLVLKELPIEAFRQWGAAIQSKPYALLSKSAILKPERAEVKPGQKNDEENPAESPALQVANMPARYRLNFDEGIRMYVRPKSEGILPAFLNLYSALEFYLVTWPLNSLWRGLHGETFAEIIVYLSERDAKSLYWAFQDGFPCIIRAP